MQKFKRVVDNNMRSYGETDLEKGVIRINKKRHQSKFHKVKRETTNKDGSEKILATIWHEEMHAKNPKMKESDIRKKEKNVHQLSVKEKQRLYNMYKGGDGRR